MRLSLRSREPQENRVFQKLSTTSTLLLNSHHPPSINPTLPTMPLDTSTYSLALLRLDGRRWNELRRLTAQISTQAAADGSSYLEMGNTKVICTVTGPSEAKSTGGNRSGGDRADVQVSISIAGFSGVDRKRRGRGDK
jgi:exosome complex component RRP41